MHWVDKFGPKKGLRARSEVVEVQPEEPKEYQPRMPSREWLKALLSYEKPDLSQIENRYAEWVKYPEYMVFKRVNQHTGDVKYSASKMAKRGNDVYHKRVREKIGDLLSIPDIQFFNYKDRSKRHKTKALFITLEFNANIFELDKLWEGVGECRVCGRRASVGSFDSVKHEVEVSGEKPQIVYTRECCGKSIRLVGGVGYAYNRFISAFRKKYGRAEVFRVWEAHKSGYPHIHLIMICENAEFEAFHHENTWRIQAKHEVEELWPWGFSDVEALASTRGGIAYVVKYLGKLHKVGIHGGWSDTAQGGDPEVNMANLVSRTSVRTLSLMWIFRKRSFSVSGGLFDVIRAMHNSNSGPRGQVDLEGNPVWVWSLIGFWGGLLSKWRVELSPNELAGLKRSSTWSESRRC